MTEDEAKVWMLARFDEATMERVSRFVGLVIAENQEQNLVSPASLSEVWSRHVVDSAQLIALAPQGAASWIDVGTGGGFPGMIVALCWSGRVTMVEPRKRRAAFLAECVETLQIANAVVEVRKVEAIIGSADIISARAVASVEKLLQAARGCSTPKTRWILPRGRSPIEDIGGRMFHVEQSVTDPASSIVTFDGVG